MILRSLSPRVLCIALAATAFALPGVAQSITLDGLVEDLPGGAGFQVGCTDVVLVSESVDLDALKGDSWRLTGIVSAASVVTVESAAPLDGFLELGGNGQAGGTLEFRVEGTPGETVLLLFSLGTALLPTAQAGTLLLDPTTMIVLLSGVVDASGTFEFTAAIPDNPDYQDLLIFVQGLRLPGTGGKVLTNVDCVTLQA